MFTFDQIAVVDDKDERVFEKYKQLCFSDWSQDFVTSKGVLRGIDGYKIIENTAFLRFNYTAFRPLEFEILRYTDGPNFLAHRPVGAISHMGVHVPLIEDYRAFLGIRGWMLIQEVVTQSHTSKAVEGKRYHYAIYSHPSSRYNLKLIERIADPVLADRKTEALLEKYS